MEVLEASLATPPGELSEASPVTPPGAYCVNRPQKVIAAGHY